MSNLKAKLSAQLSKVEEQNVVSIAPQDSCALVPTVQEAEATVITLNPQIPANNHLVQVVPEFVFSLNEAKDRILLLQKFVKELMTPGVDYGIIPGCSKPSLLKSGCEKLCDIYGFSKHVTVTNRVEDWEKGLFSYEVKATLINKRTGLVEAEGVGCCNSRERKYKSQDAFSISNTILKMAKKRALVDAVLSATRSSGLFTQDIEELNFEVDPPKSNVKPVVSAPPSTKVDTTIVKLVTKDHLKLIYALTIEKGISTEKAKALLMNRYNARESKALTSEEAQNFLLFLQNYRLPSQPIIRAK